jgi:Cch helix turn helix domain
MATQALDYIRHKAVFNERFLEGARGYHELNPLGSWRKNRDLALPRPVMCQWLIEAGFAPEAIFSEWKQKHWIITEDTKFVSRRHVGSLRQSCVVIRFEAMNGSLEAE